TSAPFGGCEETTPSFQPAVPPPIQSDHEAVMRPLERLEIRRGHHTAIPHEHDSAEAESLLQVGDDLLDRLVIDSVARPDVMGDRPARDHHHAHHDLNVARLAVAAVTVLGEVTGASPLEISAGDVVQDQVRLEAEE